MNGLNNNAYLDTWQECVRNNPKPSLVRVSLTTFGFIVLLVVILGILVGFLQCCCRRGSNRHNRRHHNKHSKKRDD